MDPQAPNVPVISPEAVATEIPDSNPQIPQDRHGVTIAAMAVFVLLALAAVTFLYYQNQQLKGMLLSYQTPIASATPAATADPTASWKTYTDSKQSFSFRYPNTSNIKLDSLNIDGSVEFNNFILFRQKTSQTLSEYVSKLKDTNLSPNPISKAVGNLSTTEWIGSYKNAPTHYVSFENGGYVYNLGLTPLTDSNGISEQNRVFFDQILSTFKFTSASPSAVPSTIPVSTSSAVPAGY